MEEEGGGRGEKEERHFLVFLAPSPLQTPHRSPCQASPPPQECRPGGNGEGYVVDAVVDEGAPT